MADHLSFDSIQIEITDNVGWLRFNRPPVNAFDWEMLAETRRAYDAFDAGFSDASSLSFAYGAALPGVGEALRHEIALWGSRKVGPWSYGDLWLGAAFAIAYLTAKQGT